MVIEKVGVDDHADNVLPRSKTRPRVDADSRGDWLGFAPIEIGWLDRHANLFWLILTVIVSGVTAGVALAYRPIFGFAVVIAIVMALCVLRRPAIGGYILAALVPITSGLRQGFPVPSLRLSELLIGTISTMVILSASSRQARRWRTVDWTVLVFVITSIVIGGGHLLNEHQHISMSLIGTLFGPLQFLLLYRAVIISLPLPHQRKVALRLLLLASIPVSLLALLQQLRIHGINSFLANITGSTIFSSYSYHFFARATGPFDHWTPLAGYLLVIMLTGIGLVLQRVEGVLSHRVMFAVLGLDAVGLLLSAELSAMAALIIGSFVLGIWTGRTRFMLRWGVIIVVVIGIAFGSYFVQRLHTEFGSSTGTGRGALIPQTLAYRWQVWTQQYFPAVRQKWLTGWGLIFPSSISFTDTESQYLTILMWGGSVLMATYLAMMWALFARGRTIARAALGGDINSALAKTVVVLVAAIDIINFIFPYFDAGGLPQAFWVLFGILAASQADIPRISRERVPTAPVSQSPQSVFQST